MKNKRARCMFPITLGDVIISVRVLRSNAAVTKEFYTLTGENTLKRGLQCQAYFWHSIDQMRGCICLSANANFFETVPHESMHCIAWFLRRGNKFITHENEERAATLVGRLTARIFSELKKRGYEL